MSLLTEIAVDMQKKRFLDFMLHQVAGISKKHAFSTWAELTALNQPPCGIYDRCPCDKAFDRNGSTCIGGLFTKKVNSPDFTYLEFKETITVFNKHLEDKYNG